MGSVLIRVSLCLCGLGNQKGGEGIEWKGLLHSYTPLYRMTSMP